MGLVPKFKLVSVTTAGTPVPLLASTDAQNNIVAFMLSVEDLANTMYVGDATVRAATGNGMLLTTIPLQLESGGHDSIDLAKIFLDATVNGAAANLLYFVKA
jgi:hypothetical protein